MTEAKVKAIVKKHQPRLVKLLGLEDWRITVYYDSLRGNAVGENTVTVPYQYLSITIDPEKVDDEAHAIDVLRHELIHCYLWPMSALATLFTEGKPDRQFSIAEYHAWTFYVERMVRGVEIMLDKLDKVAA